jgi:hypothetical protein
MDLTIFLNTDETDPRLARVESLTSLARKPLPVLVHGSTLNLTIYLITSAGAYHPSSGASGLSPRLALGSRGSTALAYTTTFAQIANGWTCTLALTTHELAVFLANTAGPLALEFSTTATGSVKTAWSSLTTALIGAVSDPAAGSAIVPPTYYTAAEVDAFIAGVDADLAAHVADVANPHSVTKAQVGLGNADNTSDAAKPVSTATQTALNLKAPIASPTFTGTVTLPGDPASALQAATKQYVDNLAAGFDVKASVVVATTANITLSGTQTIDGIAVIAGDRVLVKNQSTPAQNGIYLVAAGAWTRTTDADAWAELPGAFCFVERGSTLADTGWVCTVDSGGTIGSTAVTWSQFSGVGAYQPLNANLTAEAGLTGAADRLSYFTGLGAKALATFTAFGRTFLAYADAATAFAGIKQAATTAATGVVELATTAETLAGTSASLVPPVSAVDARAELGDLTRPVKDVLFSDGATSNRRVEWTPGTAGAVAGMPLSIPFEFQVPTSNPAASAYLFVSAGTGTSDPVSAQVNSLCAYVSTAGALIVRQNGVTLSDARAFSYSGFRAAYSGQWVRGMVVFSAGDSATAPLVYLQGVDSSASFSPSTGGTPPNWMPTTLDTTKHLSGYNFTASRFVPHAPIFGALTAAEVLEWTQTGRLPAWCEIGTGNMVGSYTSDFSVGSDSWLNSGGVTRTPNIDANADGAGIPPSNDWIKFINTLGSAQAVVPQRAGVFVAGKKYRISADVLVSVGSGISYVTIAQTGAGLGLTASSSKAAAAVTPGSVVSISGVIDVTNTGIQITPSDATGTTEASVANNTGIYLKNIVIREMGPIAKPVIQPGLVLDDNGSNLITGILASGVTPITESRDARIRGTTNTSGNQQLLATTLIPTNYRVAIFARARTGTPTVKWGTVSAGAEWVAAVALSANWSELTMVNKTSNGGSFNVWVNSTTTDIVDTVVRIQRLD